MYGIANLGATCYLNSAIICLSAFINFKTYLSTNIDENNVLHIELNTVYKDIQEKTSIPRGLLKALIDKMPELYLFQQNDLVEFLILFIEKIHQEVMRNGKVSIEDLKYKAKYKDTTLDKQRLKLDTAWFCSPTAEISPLRPFFYGQNISQIRCNTCDHIWHNYEPYMGLMLPIVGDSFKTCINAYFADETFDDWRCDKCQHRGGVKTIRLWRMPYIFIISLKRFNYDGSKNTNKVNMPLKFTMNSLKYELKSIAYHYGASGNGHYIANIYNSSEKKWYLADDCSVSKISEPDLENGYVFFYAKA